VYLDEKKQGSSIGQEIRPHITSSAHCSLLLLSDSQVKKPAADKNGRLAFLNKNLKVPIRSSSRWSFSAVLFE
jgi:hypothetical protein